MLNISGLINVIIPLLFITVFMALSSLFYQAGRVISSLLFIKDRRLKVILGYRVKYDDEEYNFSVSFKNIDLIVYPSVFLLTSPFSISKLEPPKESFKDLILLFSGSLFSISLFTYISYLFINHYSYLDKTNPEHTYLLLLKTSFIMLFFYSFIIVLYNVLKLILLILNLIFRKSANKFKLISNIYESIILINIESILVNEDLKSYNEGISYLKVLELKEHHFSEKFYDKLNLYLFSLAYKLDKKEDAVKYGDLIKNWSDPQQLYFYHTLIKEDNHIKSLQCLEQCLKMGYINLPVYFSLIIKLAYFEKYNDIKIRFREVIDYIGKNEGKEREYITNFDNILTLIYLFYIEALIKTQDFDSALKELDLLLKMQKNESFLASIYLHYALLMLDQKKYNEMFNYLDKTSEKDKLYSDIYSILMNYYRDIGEYDKYIEYFYVREYLKK